MYVSIIHVSKERDGIKAKEKNRDRTPTQLREIQVASLEGLYTSPMLSSQRVFMPYIRYFAALIVAGGGKYRTPEIIFISNLTAP